MRNDGSFCTNKELGVGSPRQVVGPAFVLRHRLSSKESVADSVTLVDPNVPTVQGEVGVVAEVDILASDRTVNFEDTVLVEAKSWAKGVWHSGVRTTNGILPCD